MWTAAFYLAALNYVCFFIKQEKSKGECIAQLSCSMTRFIIIEESAAMAKGNIMSYMF